MTAAVSFEDGGTDTSAVWSGAGLLAASLDDVADDGVELVVGDAGRAVARSPGITTGKMPRVRSGPPVAESSSAAS